jgi:hypothetical protein
MKKVRSEEPDGKRRIGRSRRGWEKMKMLM